MIMSYRWSEEDVTQHLGITKRELKTLRKERLEPLDHFEIVEGKHRFSDTGLFALCAFVKVDPPAGMEPLKKMPPAANGEEYPNGVIEAHIVKKMGAEHVVKIMVNGVLAECFLLRPHFYYRINQVIRVFEMRPGRFQQYRVRP
jgi:hypothetical protein